MSIGSHFSIYGTDPKLIVNAVSSYRKFQKAKAPYFKISYRKHTGRMRKGWTFWRIS